MVSTQPPEEKRCNDEVMLLAYLPEVGLRMNMEISLALWIRKLTIKQMAQDVKKDRMFWSCPYQASTDPWKSTSLWLRRTARRLFAVSIWEGSKYKCPSRDRLKSSLNPNPVSEKKVCRKSALKLSYIPLFKGLFYPHLC